MSSPSTAVSSQSIHINYTQHVAAYHRKAAELALKYTREGKLLDIGCGTGTVLELVHRQNPELELFGADMDENCLSLTVERTKTVTPIQMTSDGFDLSGIRLRNYDTCIMSHVLEHVLYPYDTLLQVMDLLKPGGHLVLLVPNPVRPEIVLLNLLRKSKVNHGHVHAWDRAHWMNFLERIVGLDVVEYASDEVRIIPASLKRKFPILESITVGTANIAPWFSYSNIAVIRKT